ncbi:septation ring formation regulator EzrA [Vagococcus elongatus]|uniref:Septation ring formation regulator EzrA n=1 Tax=Vagococcus elongatus TaxID=180344 RepID=A0A430ARN0_9ENTE|nr:septation ring formation regulator EzrA [Vagococcus elongatus]RSU10710.1 septation ring formation regulator EzrA [Vagococcus elongatus]
MKANINTILIVFVAIIVVVAIFYIVAVLLKRKNEEKLDKLEERKIDLFDLPVFEEIEEIKKMHLVGQSQNTFREWNQRWTDISTASFAELESRIFEVENLNETFRFIKVKDVIQDAYETMDKMEEEVEEIRDGLKELKTSEERNSLAVQEALDKYEEIAQLVKEEAKTFGPAIDEIRKQVTKIENEFTQFVALNTAGDPMEASSVLQQAEDHTYELEQIILAVPPLFEQIDKEYPAQMKEIEEGYKRMVKDHYKFSEGDLSDDIRKINVRIKDVTNALQRCEVVDVQNGNIIIEERIEELYELMEIEIKARDYVRTNIKTVRDYVGHVEKNNRQLLIELDHTSQSYTLNNNELGRTRGFQTQLEELGRAITQLDEQIKKKDVIYSEAEKSLRDGFQILKEMENQQVQISASLKDLRKGEKEAASKIEGYEFELKSLKRQVDKQRLPGIPQEYLEFFFVASDRVEELVRELNRIRIDMDYIDKLVTLCNEDLALLEEKTQELIDSAALTEQMLQYANRYRHSHELVERAIEKSMILFSEDYRYQDALDEIGVALEQVEPGAFKRIESYYYRNKNDM